jgi:drug/metabolite transporter (DMT)-like permease
MEIIWIPIAITGALMQAVRTAAQKDLNQKLSIMVTTYVRSLFGLPVLLVFLWWVMSRSDQITVVPEFSNVFLINSLALALSQLAATWLLIYLFGLRNFTVGTTLTKTDVMITAVIGSLFFSESISLFGWIAILLTLSGVVILTIARVGLSGLIGARSGGLIAALTSRPTLVGLASGFFFALSYLFVRQSSLSLEDGDFLYRAGWTVVVATSMQVMILGIWLLLRDPKGLLAMFPQWRLCLFIGLTSALGSICWYTAMTLVNASYVKAVGQIETVFTIAIATIYFREKVNALEFVGIATIIGGVLVFLL